jgi:hypothetical protein
MSLRGKRVIYLTGFFLGIILFAGCSENQLANEESSLPTQIHLAASDTQTPSTVGEVPATPFIGVNTDPVQPTSIATIVENATETPELAGQDLPAQPAVKTGLEATDPGSVQLASGRPQLIEFFAFW